MGYLTPQQVQQKLSQPQTQQPAQQGMGGYMGSSSPSPSGSMNPDAINALLAAGLISGDIPSATANFISSAFLPPKETSSQISKRKEAGASKQQAYDRATRIAKQALETVESGKNVSGFSPRYWLQTQGILPTISSNEDSWFNTRAELDALLGQLSGITAFDEAGKALTATELGIIGGKIPQIGKSEAANKQILQKILEDVESKRNEYLFSQVGL